MTAIQTIRELLEKSGEQFTTELTADVFNIITTNLKLLDDYQCEQYTKSEMLALFNLNADKPPKFCTLNRYVMQTIIDMYKDRIDPPIDVDAITDYIKTRRNRKPDHLPPRTARAILAHVDVNNTFTHEINKFVDQPFYAREYGTLIHSVYKLVWSMFYHADEMTNNVDYMLSTYNTLNLDNDLSKNEYASVDAIASELYEYIEPEWRFTTTCERLGIFDTTPPDNTVAAHFLNVVKRILEANNAYDEVDEIIEQSEYEPEPDNSYDSDTGVHGDVDDDFSLPSDDGEDWQGGFSHVCLCYVLDEIGRFDTVCGAIARHVGRDIESNICTNQEFSRMFLDEGLCMSLLTCTNQFDEFYAKHKKEIIDIATKVDLLDDYSVGDEEKMTRVIYSLACSTFGYAVSEYQKHNDTTGLETLIEQNGFIIA